MNQDVSAKNIQEAIGTILAKLCYPVAEEIGNAFGERVSAWRQKNALKILSRTEALLPKNISQHAHPRLVHEIIDNGSWTDNPMLQDMWSGLLASSCDEKGIDESNLLFINILKQLSSMQAIVLDYACNNSEKYISTALWIGSKPLEIGLERLIEITGEEDAHRIDRELDHLRALELIQLGFDPDSTTADIAPTGLALQMFVRCNGYSESPVKFYNAKRLEDDEMP